MSRRSIRDLIRAGALIVAAMIALAIARPTIADAQLWVPRKHQKPKPATARPAKPPHTKPAAHPAAHPARKPKTKPKAKPRPRPAVDDDPVIIEEDGDDDRDDPRRPK